MVKPPLSPIIDVSQWVDAARADPIEHRRRQVVDIILNAISFAPVLRDNLLLKGGTLMNLAYQSPRATTDIDFTTPKSKVRFNAEVLGIFEPQIHAAAVRLGYRQLTCKVQGVKMKPPNPHASFPTLEVRVGSAIKGGRDDIQLQSGRATHVTKLEISFNEYIGETQRLVLADTGFYLIAYSLNELIAEKLRALLQQKVRNRSRRQDVYDISRLLRNFAISESDRHTIHRILVEKATSRGIRPTKVSLRDPEVERRARSEYRTMLIEIPDETLEFDEDFATVRDFYEALPWAT